MRFLFFAAAMLIAAPAWAGGLPQAFQDLAGSWHCDGVFPSNGKTISSDVRFIWDAPTGTLTKHHDDVLPNSYQAIELWSASKKGFAARIADDFGGTRDFTSPGWNGNVLTWQGIVVAPSYERFVYIRADPGTLRIDWDVSKDGVTYKTGDTLTCKKT